MNVRIVPAYSHREEVRELFSEYTGMLIANEESFRDYLALQNYEEEVRHLEECLTGGCISYIVMINWQAA